MFGGDVCNGHVQQISKYRSDAKTNHVEHTDAERMLDRGVPVIANPSQMQTNTSSNDAVLDSCEVDLSL